jgi:hypothetical protein
MHRPPLVTRAWRGLGHGGLAHVCGGRPDGGRGRRYGCATRGPHSARGHRRHTSVCATRPQGPRRLAAPSGRAGSRPAVHPRVCLPGSLSIRHERCPQRRQRPCGIRSVAAMAGASTCSAQRARSVLSRTIMALPAVGASASSCGTRRCCSHRTCRRAYRRVRVFMRCTPSLPIMLIGAHCSMRQPGQPTRAGQRMSRGRLRRPRRPSTVETRGTLPSDGATSSAKRPREKLTWLGCATNGLKQTTRALGVARH